MTSVLYYVSTPEKNIHYADILKTHTKNERYLNTYTAHKEHSLNENVVFREGS